VSEHPPDLGYRDALAQAHHDLGTVFRTRERWPESERELKAAAVLWDALARERPEIAEYRSKLADAHGRLGDQYQIQGRTKEAEAVVRQARDLADRLAREHPEVDTYQESLATILVGFAKLQGNRLNDIPGAIASVQRAVAITEQLVRDHPEMVKYQLSLGGHLAILGDDLATDRKFPQAEAAVQRSIAILEKLAADHPQDLKIAAALADTYKRMNVVVYFRGDLQSSLEWAGREIQALRSLARRDPHNLWIGRRQLWIALAGRGETLMHLGRLPEALAHFEEVLELTHDTKDGELFRAFHALAKARLGDLSELAFLGDQVRDTLKAGAGSNTSPYYFYMLYYDAACGLTALANLAHQDRGKPLAVRESLAQRDLDVALEFLDKARSDGELKGLIKLDEIRHEPLLKALHSHPRFQVLMMDLAFPDNPFRP
jgi:tetratricopeptide (TPR) repeat protein